MFNQNSGYSLSDIAAINRGDGGWGADGGAWWIIILLLAFSGWGNGGMGGGNGATTREEIAYGFEMNGLANGIRGIQQGLCDGFYAVNTGMLNGFNGINNAITQSTIADMQSDFALQTAFNNNTNALSAQLNAIAADQAACCCATQRELERGFCETGKAIADSAREIIEFLTQDKIASLTAENQTLKFAASQQAQNAYLINELGNKPAIPAYIVANPYGATCGC